MNPRVAPQAKAAALWGGLVLSGYLFWMAFIHAAVLEQTEGAVIQAAVWFTLGLLISWGISKSFSSVRSLAAYVLVVVAITGFGLYKTWWFMQPRNQYVEWEQNQRQAMVRAKEKYDRLVKEGQDPSTIHIKIDPNEN